jgi:site-specific recombinase XerD
MVTIHEAISGSLLVFSSGFSENTANIYRIHLDQLEKFLLDRGITRVDQLHQDHMLEFFHYLKNDYVPKRASGDKSPYKPASLANAWCALRMLDKFLVEEFTIAPLTSKLKKPKWKPPQIIPFTKEEIEKNIAAAEFIS